MNKLVAYFKRTFKEPIKSLADADQKEKDVKKLLIGSLIVFVVGIVLSFVVKALGVIYYIGIAGLLAGGFLKLVIKRDRKRFKFLTCESCKTQASITTEEDFEKYVEYEILEVFPSFAEPYKLESKTPGVYDTVRVNGSVIMKGKLSLKCANCGEVKTTNFSVVPFRCSLSERDITYGMTPQFVELMKEKIKLVLDEWMDEENEYDIPLTTHSIYHESHQGTENTGLVVGSNNVEYKGVNIVYSRYPDEMIEGYFLRNEFECNILDEENKK